MTNWAWDGQSTLDGPLAMTVSDCEPLADGDASRVPSVAVAALGRSVTIDPPRLGAFLDHHRDSVIACFNVDETFRGMQTLLRDQCDERGRTLLLGFVRSCRMHDIRILHPLLQLILCLSSSEPQTLEQIVDFLKENRSLGWDEVGDVDLGEPTGPNGVGPGSICPPYFSRVGSILKVYLVQRMAAARISDVVEIDEGLSDKFGPLSAGLQSQGAIALGQMGRRGLNLRAGAADRMESECERHHRNSSRRLLDAPLARKAFRHKNGVVVRNQVTKYPIQKPRELRDWLKKELDSTRGISEIPPEPPLTIEGDISIFPEFWGDLVKLSRPLRDWAIMWSAAKVAKALQNSNVRGDNKLRPSYEMFPRLMSRNPDMEGVKTLGDGRAFEPEPGSIFLIGRLPELLLRSFAQFEVQIGRGSLVSNELEFGADPIEALAARLFDRKATRMEGLDSGDPATVGHFDDLHAGDPDRIQWKKIASGLAEAVLMRLDPATAREALERDHLITLDERSIEPLWNDLIEILSNLLDSHGEDRTVEVASKKLGCYEFELLDVLVGDSPLVKSKFLRDLLQGRRIDRDAFGRVARLNRNDALTELLHHGTGSHSIYQRIFDGWAATGTGRIRKGPFFSSRRYDGLTDMVEDTIKATLFSVVAADFDLVGWAGSEFVVQVFEKVNIPEEIERLKEVAKQSAMLVLGRFAPDCEVSTSFEW